MTNINLPDTLTASNREENDQPWGRLVSSLSNLETVDIYKDHFKIGRSASCDIQIDESKIALNIFGNISKEHFVLFKDSNSNKMYIKDLSKNGTFLNGNKISRHKNVIIRDNDEIAIGQKNLCAFIFRSLLIEELPDTPVDVLSNSPTAVPVVVRPTWGRLLSCWIHLDSFDLSKSTFKIGRSSQCDVCIDKTELNAHVKQKFSKEHFLIVKDPNSHITFITDLSRMGTFLNGHLIGKNQRHILQNDDTIGIGPRNTRVYVYKSMYSLDSNYLPPTLRTRYEPSTLLGKGGCGEVRLAFEKITCKMYAIKKIIKGRSSSSQMHLLNHPSKINTEINILQNLTCCPFIINMKEIIETEDEVFIVLDYMKGGELNNRILSREPMTEANVKFLFYQMVQAVNFLHLNGIAHRDLKPENVLLSSDNVETLIKISDFGLSKVSDEMMRTMCGTWQYIAPEVLDNQIPEYDKQVDVWSLGVILFYMLSKRLPFNSSDKGQLRKLILNGMYIMDDPSWDGVSHLAKSLVREMLTVDPQKRITIQGILNHIWLANDTLMQYRVKTLLQNNTSGEFEELVTTDESTTDKPQVKRIRLSSSDDSDECQLGIS